MKYEKETPKEKIKCEQVLYNETYLDSFTFINISSLVQ